MISLWSWLPSLIEGFTFYGGGKGGGSPKAPDYSKLAQAQADAQIAINRQSTKANRPDQITPWMSQTWEQGGGSPVTTFDQAGYDAAMQEYQTQLQQQSRPNSDWLNNPYGPGRGASTLKAPDYNSFLRTGQNADQWTSRTTLDPELQKILDNEFATKQQGYGELQSYLSNINDPSRVNAAPINPGQTAQDAIMARLNPTFNQREEADRTRLYNQGVRPGTEAWDNEMRNFNMARNDAYSQAALHGIGLDTQARQNALAEQALPMNAINSFLSGSSVPNPGFGNFAQQPTAQAPDLLGAAQSQYGADLNSYNAKQAQGGNMMSGLMSMGGTVLGGMFGGPAGAYAGGALGGALGGGGGGSFSDIRLKSNIVKVGEHPKGFGIYEYDIFDQRERGVMAQEVELVMPEAVFTDPSGYKKVNYEVING